MISDELEEIAHLKAEIERLRKLNDVQRMSDTEYYSKMVLRAQDKYLAVEMKYRRELWRNHGHIGLYSDDGEMQCGKCRADFKRFDLEKLEEIIHKARMNHIREALAKLQSGSSLTDG